MFFIFLFLPIFPRMESGQSTGSADAPDHAARELLTNNALPTTSSNNIDMVRAALNNQGQTNIVQTHAPPLPQSITQQPYGTQTGQPIAQQPCGNQPVQATNPQFEHQSHDFANFHRQVAALTGLAGITNPAAPNHQPINSMLNYQTPNPWGQQPMATMTTP